MDRMGPDPDYGLFATVVELGSFSAAARFHRVSPAMVSKRMSRLERRLGVHLMHRTTRSLALTHAGKRFHEDVVAILDSIQSAEARLLGEQEILSGPLKISAPTSFGRLHVAPIMTPFLDAHPHLRVELNLTDHLVNLARGGIDLAIRITNQLSPALIARRLASNRRILCASPGYLDRFGAPATLDELTRHRVLAAEGQSSWRLSGPEGVIEWATESFVRTNSSEVVRELAIAGAGVALRSLWDVSEELTAGRLVRLLPGYEGASDVGIYAVYPQTPFIPAKVSRFVDYLRSAFGPHPPWERETP